MPLLDPVQSTLFFLNTDAHLPAELDTLQVQVLSRRYDLIHTAALAAGVPVYAAVREDRTSDGQSTPQASPDNRYTYPPGMARAFWLKQGLAQAISSQKRSALVIVGSWLETDITFLALTALADGFDAHVVFDASPCKDPAVQQMTIDRMVQAGVVPLSTLQMLHEWAECCGDGVQRHTLLDLAGRAF